MSARPYQVGDRVMVSCTDGEMRPGTVDRYEVFPSHPDEPAMRVRLDTPYHHGATELVLAHVWVSGDHTTVTGPVSVGARCEPIAPTNPSGDAVKDAAPASSGAPSEPDWDAMAEAMGDFECAACEGDFEASHSAACVDWERERAGTRVISGSNSLVAMDLAEAAATFAKSAEALLQLPADSNPEAVRAAFAAARRALDEFEGASR